MLDLALLHNRFVVDRRELERRVQKLLIQQEQIELAEVLAYYPLTKGLTELLMYYAIATENPCHSIDSAQQRTILLTTVENRNEVCVTIPRVTYCREMNQEKEAREERR